MKKFYSKLLLGSSIVLLLAGGAQAVPIFAGGTYADWGVGGYVSPDEAQGPGYYMWSNDAERNSWSVRWTGGDWTLGSHEWAKVIDEVYDLADVYEWYSWNGEISYHGEITSLSWVS